MGALGMATRKDLQGKPLFSLLLSYQIGRISSYALAGFTLGGLGTALVQFIELENLTVILRWLTAIVLALIAFNMLGLIRNIFEIKAGQLLWRKLASFTRRFLPIKTIPRAFTLGALWGWMPCGFVYSVLLLAWLSMDAVKSAAIMLAFGVGTVPALLAGSFGAGRGFTLLVGKNARSVAGAFLLSLAVLTTMAPWLLTHTGWHVAHWLPFDCTAH